MLLKPQTASHGCTPRTCHYTEHGAGERRCLWRCVGAGSSSRREQAAPGVWRGGRWQCARSGRRPRRPYRTCQCSHQPTHRADAHRPLQAVGDGDELGDPDGRTRSVEVDVAPQRTHTPHRTRAHRHARATGRCVPTRLITSANRAVLATSHPHVPPQGESTVARAPARAHAHVLASA